MTDQQSQPPDLTSRYLRWTAMLFALGWGVHVLDHLRRGMSAAPHAIMVGFGSAVTEIGTGIVFAIVGTRARRVIEEVAR